MDGGTCSMISRCCTDNQEEVIEFSVYTILRRCCIVFCVRARARAAALAHKGWKMDSTLALAPFYSFESRRDAEAPVQFRTPTGPNLSPGTVQVNGTFTKLRAGEAESAGGLGLGFTSAFWGLGEIKCSPTVILTQCLGQINRHAPDQAVGQ